MSSKGEITCNCQLGNECEGNFSHPSMVCCSYSNDPQTKVIWDMKKQIEVLNRLIKCRGEEIAKSHIDIINMTQENEGLKEENNNLENMLGESYSKHDVFDMTQEIEKLKGELSESQQEAEGFRNEYPKLKKENEELKEKESVVDEVFEGLKKNEKEYIHRNNILQRENEKLKETLTKVDSLVSPVLFGEGDSCGCGLTDNCDCD